MERRPFLVTAVSLILSGCFRRDDGTQPGTGGGPRGDAPGPVADGPETGGPGVTMGEPEPDGHGPGELGDVGGQRIDGVGTSSPTDSQSAVDPPLDSEPAVDS